eukprot:6184537-Pleurochrysis_carterae.AAC.1
MRRAPQGRAYCTTSSIHMWVTGYLVGVPGAYNIPNSKDNPSCMEKERELIDRLMLVRSLDLRRAGSLRGKRQER